MSVITKEAMFSAYSKMTTEQLDGDCAFTYVHLTNRCLPLSIGELNTQIRDWKICEKQKEGIHRINPRNHKNFTTNDEQLWYGCFVQRYTMDLELDKEANPLNPFALMVVGYGISGLMYAFRHEAVRNSFVAILNFKWKNGYIFELKSVAKLLATEELYKKTLTEFYCDDDLSKMVMKHFPDFVAEQVNIIYAESLFEDEEYCYINGESCELGDFAIMASAVNKLSEKLLSKHELAFELERQEEEVRVQGEKHMARLILQFERQQEIQRQADEEIERLRKQQVKEASRENQEKQEKQNSKKANKEKHDKASKAKQHAKDVKDKEILRIKMEKEKKHKANNRSSSR